MPDELARIKEQIQMLHERLEGVELSVQSLSRMQVYSLQNDINNIKIILNEMRYERSNT